MATSSQHGEQEKTAAVAPASVQSTGRVLARRWRRSLRTLPFLLGALAAAALIWRMTCLIGLPAVGEPFDVAAFRSYRVEPEEDAFILYREALGRLKTSPLTQDFQGAWKMVRGGWSKASPEVHTWVVESRDALAVWRRGTELAKAMPIALGEEKLEIQWPQALQHLIDFTYLALLEGSRLEESGDLTGAWGWYNASLRASKHVRMHAPSDYHALGAMMYDMTAQRLSAWAANPRTDGPTLRKALTDMQEVVAMTAPNSDIIKADYLAFLWAIDHPDGWMTPSLEMGNLKSEFPTLFQAAVFLKREPERSRRVVRIMISHWLAHADDPPQTRPKMAETRVDGNHSYPDFPYHAAPGQKDAAHPLSNEKLYAWHQSTLYLKNLGLRFVFFLPLCDGERTGQKIMLVTLAEQLYLRERGMLPESAEDLVTAGYLTELPEGYANERPSPEEGP